MSISAKSWVTSWDKRPAVGALAFDPPVIVTCLKSRYSGGSATISALIPVQARRRNLAFVGPRLPGVVRAIDESPDRLRVVSLLEAIKLSRRKLSDGRPRIWHVRRNREMMLAVILRDILRLPIKLVFTSAAIRRHSALPRWLIGRMDGVIATTPLAASFLPRAAAVIGHGVDVEHFHPPSSRDEEWAGRGLPGRRGIGIFGRVRKEKGIHIFVRALLELLPRFPDVTAIVGGLCQAADRDFLQGLLREIAEAGLSDRFVWTGDIAPQDMPHWYRRVAITVCCPLYEGYGLTALEAMASGCAVAASRTGAFATLVEDGQSGHLVPLNDASALAAALEDLFADAARCDAMGRQGRERACRLFSVEAEAEAIERVYEQVWRG